MPLSFFYNINETFLALISLLIWGVKFSKEDWDEDAELVRQVKQGNKDAFLALYDKYNEETYRHCCRLLSRLNEAEEEAREAMAEAFAKGLEKIYSLKEDGKFFVWLRRIAYTISIDRLKDRGKFIPIEVDDEEDDKGSSPSGIRAGSIPDAAAKNPETEAGNMEIQKIIRNALNALPENYRQAIILAHQMGYTHSEAAELMGCKEDDVKRWVFRGLLKLREMDILKKCWEGLR